MSLVSWGRPGSRRRSRWRPRRAPSRIRPGRDVDDPGLAVRGVGDDAGLRAGERPGLVAEVGDRHREQRHRDPLAGGQQHVELARPAAAGVTCSARSISSSVVSPIAETTTTTSLPALLGGDDPLGDPLDAVGVGDGRTAVLLHDEAHRRLSSPVRRHDRPDCPGHGPGRLPRVERPRPSSISSAAASLLRRSTGERRRRAGRGRRPTGAARERAALGARCPRTRRRRTATTTAPRWIEPAR